LKELHKIYLTNRWQTGNTLERETFIEILANPQKLGKKELVELDAILHEFPYLQSAHALRLKALKNENSFLYNDALKKTAAYTTDRDILFDFITSEKFLQNEISQFILQHDESVAEIEVIAEDVSKSLISEDDNEIKKAEAILNPLLFERKVASVIEIADFENTENKASEKSPSEILEIEKPLDFSKDDTHSFSEWLKLTSAQPIARLDEEKIIEESILEVSNDKDENERERKFKLIDSFIENNPKLTQNSIEEPAKPKIVRHIDFTENASDTSRALMTETLAKVYLQQKNYTKAIQAYKILILKNPEKSGFFADQIRAINKLTNTDPS